MKITEAKGKLKVGDWVRTNGSETMLTNSAVYFEGEIGEINKKSFYVWQDTRDGFAGKIKPSTKGYKYNWRIAFDNPVAKIKILKTKKLVSATKNINQRK